MSLRRAFPIPVAVLIVGMALLYRWSAVAEISSRTSALGGLNLERYTVRQWTTSDGLPAGQIQALCQTRDGYLWIGTRHGLARFNGTEFRTVPHLNCLSMAEDEDGVLWIGTTYGLYQAIEGHVNAFAIEPPPKSKTNLDIWAMCPAKGGGVWVQDSDSLVLIQGGKTRRIHEAQIRNPRPKTLCEDSAGGVWMAGEFAANRYDPQALKVEVCPRLPSSFLKIPIDSLMRDRAGGLWLGEDWGAIHWFKDGQVTTFPASQGSGLFRYTSMVEDESGTIWTGSSGGLGQVRSGEVRKVEALKEYSFGDHPILFPSSEGGIWVGTTKDGLYLVQRKKVAALTKAEGLIHNDTWSISEDQKGNVWIGTYRGLSRLTEGNFTHYTTNDGLKGVHVRTVTVDRAGRVWAGTDGVGTGLIGALHLFESNRFTNLEKAIGFAPANVSWLTPGHDDSLWITSDLGLSRWKEGNMLFRVFKKREAGPTFIDRHHRLWLGGAYLGYQAGEAIQWVGETNGLQRGKYAPVHEDEEDAIWLISPDKGIFRYKHGRLANISTKQGLLSDLNLSLLDDGLGRYWFNCYKGIYWVQKTELNAVADGKKDQVTCVSYGMEDGLPSLEGNGGNSPNACQTRDGRLWFPTTRGVAIIDPKTTLHDNRAPAVLIEEVRCDGEVLQSTLPEKGGQPNGSTEIRIPAGRGNSIVISYAAPSFTAPEKTRYRYRLEGHDKNWVDAQGQPFVHFAKLKPGPYRFHVTACNHRGIWNPVGAQLAFTIAPFFYQTWTFYGICGAVMLGLGGAIQAYRLSVQKRILGLEREAALAKERERIARDMHDDLGANLTRIARLSELAKAEAVGGGEVTSRIEKISTAAGELVDSMGELVWATNPKYDHLQSMAAYFREYAAQHFEGSGIICHLDFPEQATVVPVTADLRRQLFLVLKEALQNVVKHAQAKEVWVKMGLSGKELKLEVRDDGKGMDCKHSPDFHHGLSNMRERMRLLGGKLDISSEPGNGTVITAEVQITYT